MKHQIILGVKDRREERLKYITYREIEIAKSVGIVDDTLYNNLDYYLTYIKYSRQQENSGRITYFLSERNGKGLGEVCIVMTDINNTRVEIDTFPIGSVAGVNEEWRKIVFQIIEGSLEVLITSDATNKVERKALIEDPRPPSNNSPIEEWFQYKYHMGRRFTHKSLANATGYTEGSIRQKYALWKKSYE